MPAAREPLPSCSLHTQRAWCAGWLAALPWAAALAQSTEETEVERAAPRAWDAAIGFVVNHGPRYPGSAQRDTGLTPGLAVRWGRFSLASRSAFSVRGAEAASGGGLRVELAQGERLRSSLGLRLDSGRRESECEGLRDLPLTPALGVNGTLSLGWADRRHLQSYFGITPEQATRSGYPVTPMSAGLRDVTLGAGWRYALAPRWALFGGASATRLIDEAASSPLVRERDGWSLNAGLVHRF